MVKMFSIIFKLSVKNPHSPFWHSQRVPSPAYSTSNPLFLIWAHLGNIWNAKVGKSVQEIPGVTGKIGLGVQNEAGQRLTEFCQENTLVIANILFQWHRRSLDITRWSVPNLDWLYSLQPKVEKHYTVSKNKTGSWLWHRSLIPYCQIQTEMEESRENQ